MYRSRLFILLVLLLTKLIVTLRKIIREPIIMKSNRPHLISSVIIIPIRGINNRKIGYKILLDIFKTK